MLQLQVLNVVAAPLVTIVYVKASFCCRILMLVASRGGAASRRQWAAASTPVEGQGAASSPWRSTESARSKEVLLEDYTGAHLGRSMRAASIGEPPEVPSETLEWSRPVWNSGGSQGRGRPVWNSGGVPETAHSPAAAVR